MQFARPAVANDPKRFGRGRVRLQTAADVEMRVSDDLRLFATTFLGGFVFVTLYLG